ncbi:MAG: hypothetical protein HQK57_05145 [Deltaproteobacteria bacterium]|nr:hypothetical protein [Deltaproteobacteria bacterium]MBF0508296.1 hypothetical protein [Deltaproteobacteria bacterium]
MDGVKYSMGPVDRIIFFGSGLLMVEAMELARQRGFEVHAFFVKRHGVENIEAGSGCSLQDTLRQKGFDAYESPDLNGSAQLSGLVNDRTIGLGFGEAYTFNADTIRLFNGRLFDFMTIRLPLYRGGAHFTWQILRQSRIGCWHIQLINEDMVPGVNHPGMIMKTREYRLPAAARTPQDYFDAARREGLFLFQELLTDIQEGREQTLTAQQENLSLYLPRLNTLRHGFIDWTWTAGEIERFVAAFDDPYPGASTFVAGRRMFLKDVQADASEGAFHPFAAGLIYRIFAGTVYVAARDGALLFGRAADETGHDVIPELRPGMRFFTPRQHLEAAMTFAADYDTEGLVVLE